MSATLTISDVGLRLIKAYEGFRPVDVELVTGQRVAGYGHRVMTGETLFLTEKKAEKLLKRDLAPFEAMINDSIFAPLTQSQFDALCSLAFNIGPKKFLESDVVQALNNGRVLDAANGFDVWRKGTLNGETYIVDALVRRRSAEKVLFLRPNIKAVRAPRAELETTADTELVGRTTAAPERILEDSGLVPVLNFSSEGTNDAQVERADTKVDDVDVDDDVKDPILDPNADLMDILKDMFVERRNPNADVPVTATPMRRRDDRPGGVLTLSEVFDDDAEMSGTEDLVEQKPSLKSDENEPLIKDLEGFTLDIETQDSEHLNVMDLAQDAAIDADDILDMELTDIDPSSLIVGAGDEVDTSDGNIELSEIEMAPSPIATAAAEVSGRLDALMAQVDENALAPDNKVLPFRGRKAAESLVPMNADQDITNASGDLVSEKDARAQDAKDDTGKTLAEQKDSASRYIANDIAPAKSQSSHLGVNLLVIFGMVLLAVSVATMMSGFDSRLGVGGEFLSTVGALLGLMITLGSIYYSLKNRV